MLLFSQFFVQKLAKQFERFNGSIPRDFVTSTMNRGKDKFAFGRGTQTFIVFNLDKDDKIKEKKLQTGMEPGEYCDVVSGEVNSVGFCSGKLISVNKKGEAKFTVGKMSAVAIHPGMKVPWKHTTPAVVYNKVKETAGNVKEGVDDVTDKAKQGVDAIKNKAEGAFKGAFGG